MRFFRKAVLLASLVTLPFAAQAEDRLKVVTSFTVIADMARNVAGEGVDVVSITKPGAEIHGYEPTPRDMVSAQDADLILAVGARLGEATTDGYTLITPDHPGQTLVHVHPDPSELGRVYRPTIAINASPHAAHFAKSG